jgi:hypothetical protein
MSKPSIGHVGFYWTVLIAVGLDHPDEPQVRHWTGYSWLEAGKCQHIASDDCLVLGDELEPPE